MINKNLDQAIKSADEIHYNVSLQENLRNTDYEHNSRCYKSSAKKYKENPTSENYECMVKSKDRLMKSISDYNYYLYRTAQHVQNSLDSIANYIKESSNKVDMSKVSHILAKIYGNMSDTIGGPFFYQTICQSIKKCRDAMSSEECRNAMSSEDISIYLLDNIEELARKISHNNE